MFVLKLSMQVIVEIDVSGKGPVQKTRVLRRVFGFTDKSNNGKYEYERPGLVSVIPGARRIKSGLLIEKRYEARVVQALKRLRVRYSIIDLEKT